MQSLKERKASCREQLKISRGKLTVTERRRYDDSICQRMLALPHIREAEVLFMFLSHGNEVDTHHLLDELRRMGKIITAPRILDKASMIAVPFDSWELLQPEQLGILAPLSKEPVSYPIDICITPGLGFSTSGGRLGYGRGYYDRWFRANRVKFKIAPAYECQILDDLPWDETDVPVDMIVTESRIIQI